jgi:hypothetical protein
VTPVAKAKAWAVAAQLALAAVAIGSCVCVREFGGDSLFGWGMMVGIGYIAAGRWLTARAERQMRRIAARYMHEQCDRAKAGTL